VLEGEAVHAIFTATDRRLLDGLRLERFDVQPPADARVQRFLAAELELVFSSGSPTRMRERSAFESNW